MVFFKFANKSYTSAHVSSQFDDDFVIIIVWRISNSFPLFIILNEDPAFHSMLWLAVQLLFFYNYDFYT